MTSCHVMGHAHIDTQSDSNIIISSIKASTQRESEEGKVRRVTAVTDAISPSQRLHIHFHSQTSLFSSIALSTLGCYLSEGLECSHLLTPWRAAEQRGSSTRCQGTPQWASRVDWAVEGERRPGPHRIADLPCMLANHILGQHAHK